MQSPHRRRIWNRLHTDTITRRANLAPEPPDTADGRDPPALPGVDVPRQAGVPAVPAQARLLLPDLSTALAGRPRAVDDRRGARAQRQRVALRRRRRPCAGRPAHRRAGSGEHRHEEQELERVHLHGRLARNAVGWQRLEWLAQREGSYLKRV
jgi:hypothetical protein